MLTQGNFHKNSKWPSQMGFDDEISEKKSTVKVKEGFKI